MANTSVLKRVSNVEQKVQKGVDVASARKVATSWMQLVQCEEALGQMGTGVFAWRAAPAIQVCMAAMVADMLAPTDKIMTLGFQAYPWVRAAGTDTAGVLGIQLGKQLPENVYAATADDIVAAMKPGRVVVVAIHAESATDWNDVRAITTAAVKYEVPMMMVISAAVQAPKGVIVETIETWQEAVNELRVAMQSVRMQKAIRVLAVADMDAATLERSMMEAAAIPPAIWAETLEKNADGAELAVTSAYQAPVRSF